MNEMERYGALLKDAMESRGMTGKDFAQVVGWSQSVVSDLIRGRRTVVPPDVARTVEQVLAIPMRTQLQVLGYLDAEEPEPGVAYVIREDDPRSELLAILEGMTHADVARVADLVALATRLSRGDKSPVLPHRVDDQSA